MGVFLSQQKAICPPALLEKASGRGRAITAIVGAGHALALESAQQAFDNGLIEPVLVGERQAIEESAAAIRWDISSFRLEEAAGEESVAAAGAALAASAEVQMVMKGHIHSDTFMRPLLDKHNGVRTKARLSHVFHMSLPGEQKSLLLTDCALNVAPTVMTRVAIVENAVILAHRLGTQRPRVALLAASESVSAAMPITGECKEIIEHFKQRSENRPLMEIAGPLAFDNVVSEESAQLKGISSPVAGHADIIVVPTIETGNALFKMMVYFMGACAAGLVLGGKVPILLTSRADPAAARLASAALGVISRESL